MNVKDMSDDELSFQLKQLMSMIEDHMICDIRSLSLGLTGHDWTALRAENYSRQMDIRDEISSRKLSLSI